MGEQQNVPQYIPNVSQYQGMRGSAYMDSHSSSSDFNNNHNTNHNDDEELSLTQVIQQKGPISLLQSLFKTIFYFMISSLDSYPIISSSLASFYIVQTVISLITRWFDRYFALNIYTNFSPLSLLHWIIPSSFPLSVFSAVFAASYGLRVEELRGSSYTLIFILLMFFLTQGSLFALQAIIKRLSIPHLLPLAWYAHLGIDYIPLSLLVLHAFLTKDYYVHIMGLPYRLHVIPAVVIYSSLVGALHLTVPVGVYIAVFWVFLLKYVWLNATYTRFTGLLLTPTICSVSPLEFNPRWTYRPELDFDQQVEHCERTWSEVSDLKKYTISLKTSEHFGEFVGTSCTIQRASARVEMVQLLMKNSPSNSTSRSTSIAAMSGGDDIDQLEFNSLGPSSNSFPPSPSNHSEVSILRSSGSGNYFNETTGLLNDNDEIDPNNQCLTVGDYYSEFHSNGFEKCTTNNCIQHLKFRRVIYKLQPNDANPDYIKYLTMKDDDTTALQKNHNGKLQYHTNPVKNDNSNNV